MRIAVAFALAIGGIVASASPGHAQTRLTSLDELRRALAVGDVVTVAAGGEPVAGRLLRIGDADLTVAPIRGPRDRRPVTILLGDIRSLERARDPVRNGVVLGAVIGAGVGGALFVHALATDRNEIDEWAGFYAGATAITTGLGALVGWAMDASRSKRHLRFEVPLPGRVSVRIKPAYTRGRGVAISASFVRKPFT